jgi:hypothetical protein
MYARNKSSSVRHRKFEVVVTLRSWDWHRNEMPRWLPFNWVAILFPPIAQCIALGISMMVAEISGR